MMKKVYYLSNCATCQRILSELNLSQDFEYQDVKHKPITPEQLDQLKEDVGRYELLFNKRSQQFKERNIDKTTLTEDDYRNLILEHYSFLKRPIIVMGNRVFLGNATKIIKEVRRAL